MINGDIKYFLDMLYTGQELVFSYEGTTFFIQGWTKDGMEHLECWHYRSPDDGFLWERNSKSQADNADAFLASPIWHGRTFMEVQDQIKWMDE